MTPLWMCWTGFACAAFSVPAALFQGYVELHQGHPWLAASKLIVAVGFAAVAASFYWSARR